MRMLRLLVACLFLAAGALLGALNPQPVTIDFGPASLQAGLGASLLGAMLVVALPLTDEIGFGAVAVFVVWHVWRSRSARTSPA